MQTTASDWAEGHKKVEDLCRQLIALVATSREQRHAIDRILAELRTVTHRVEIRSAVRAADSGRSFRAQPSRMEWE